MKFSGPQSALDRIGLMAKDNYSIPLLSDTDMTPRNKFPHGDLTHLKVSTEDVFLILNLRELLSNVDKHGLAIWEAATHGASMKHWVVTKSDFEYIEQSEPCRRAFRTLCRNDFVRTVFLHMLMSDKVPELEDYDRMTIMGARELVHRTYPEIHPTIRCAIQFFQNIRPGVEEDKTTHPNLHFLWTVQSKFITPHGSILPQTSWMPSKIMPNNNGSLSYLDDAPGPRPLGHPQPPEYKFSKADRAWMRGEIDRYQFNQKFANDDSSESPSDIQQDITSLPQERPASLLRPLGAFPGHLANLAPSLRLDPSVSMDTLVKTRNEASYKSLCWVCSQGVYWLVSSSLLPYLDDAATRARFYATETLKMLESSAAIRKSTGGPQKSAHSFDPIQHRGGPFDELTTQSPQIGSGELECTYEQDALAIATQIPFY